MRKHYHTTPESRLRSNVITHALRRVQITLICLEIGVLGLIIQMI